jgi:hypothetical protein
MKTKNQDESFHQHFVCAIKSGFSDDQELKKPKPYLRRDALPPAYQHDSKHPLIFYRQRNNISMNASFTLCNSFRVEFITHMHLKP